MTGPPTRRWAVAAAATLILGVAWLRTGVPVFLVLTAVGALVTGVATWRVRPKAAAGTCAALLIAFAGFEGLGARRMSRFSADPDSEMLALQVRATAALAERLQGEADGLRRLAVQALDVPASPAAAFAALEELRSGDGVRAIVLARGGSLAAWSGHYVAPVDSLPGPVGVVATEFYLVLYAIAGRDRDRAVATALVHAEPPAEVLAEALDGGIAEAFDVAGFTYSRPGSGADSVGVVTAAGVPVLAVRAIALGAPALRQRLSERGRERGAALIALALIAFLAATWRSGELAERFGALGVTLAMLATLPLADLSNRTPLFNPAFFFAPAGGALTGSIGALALTSATVLVAVLAAQRAQLFPRRAWQAGVVIVTLAAAGPFLLGAIARGIRFPATGAPVVLWLAWETTVFLAALVVLYAGLSAGEAALGRRRGLPLWLPPVLAAAAAGLAPLVVQPRGGLPSWYTVLWVVTAIAMALARHDRRSLWAAATVAAFGSSALVWSETVKARVLLAEQDVAALGVPDPASGALITRFPQHLDSNTAPRSRVELLARFAGSDLASSELPVNVTAWTATGTVMADLRVGMGPGSASGIEFFALEAADKMQPVLTNYPGEPGMLTILAIPHADRTVTTVVVAPRTRLVTPDPFPTLSGLGRTRDAGGEPPYTLQYVPAPLSQYISTEAEWTSRNEELHGDWFLPPTRGTVMHVHARVPLAGIGALTTRGALMVCANLGLLGFLWLLIVVSDGGALRWLRDEARPWLRSYRARLTLSLFAAFMIPAAAFAAWSYGRLQDEDAETRTLLVRETLRGVTAAPANELDSLAARFQTPLMLFANGTMVQTSDVLLDALAPLGRLLPATAARALIEDDDGFATAEISVGGEPIRFGFRVVNDTASAASLVLAAPARTVELALDPRRRDLAFFVLFATLAGALGALWVSGVAGRTFSRPIGELRAGALALAAGEREPQLAGNPPLEFEQVFNAFRQMARDLESGRARDARAQRVLAWGEMARQVAHEIKNPLTPMRLGVQHLQRAKDDPRVDFRKAFDENAVRLLSEIDRLDEIARAFSRYGAAPEAQPPAIPVDIAEVVRDVVRLERLGGDAVAWELEGADAPLFAMARPTELREVLLNLLENARFAEARHVVVRIEIAQTATRISVTDDGHGISADAMPRVFEPHFSTRTSGSGMGLAISRRVIDSWGGAIAVASTPGSGATVTISLVPAATG
ncbi:MAG: HAMP domain-containing sensor histidine kinase [Gemmatimonadetes bacterium]|nr:HAMP domain-containing sensor histidine kinase [Gemmatimonadota bacterium]